MDADEKRKSPLRSVLDRWADGYGYNEDDQEDEELLVRAREEVSRITVRRESLLLAVEQVLVLHSRAAAPHDLMAAVLEKCRDYLREAG